MNRFASVATFGLPIAESEAIAVDPLSGRPALAVPGSGRYQFSTLDTWPDGTARWVLVDLLTDVAAGLPTDLLITEGTGVSAGTDLAAVVGDEIRVDTGPLQVRLSSTDFNLFDSVTVDGQALVSPSAEPGLYATLPLGGLLTPGADTSLTIERNGPAFAMVAARGSLVDGGNVAHAWFTCRFIFRAASRDVETTLTLRNASITKKEHLLLGSLEMAVDLDPGVSPTVSITTHAGVPTHVQALGPAEEAVFYLGQTGMTVTDVSSTQYRPHIPKLVGSNTVLEDRGYRLDVAGVNVHALGDVSQFPAKPFLNLTGPNGGVTVAVQRGASLWPLGLEADGQGVVRVGAFTRHNDDGYTFLWQQHESRTAVFSFHRAPPLNPARVALALDHPVSGRAANYAHYRDAKVFPYDLVTTEQAAQVLTALGINHPISVSNKSTVVTRYLFAHTTGGSNNHPLIQTMLAAFWLRSGRGGYFLEGLDLALYKSEWQIRRSDDFADDGPNALKATNDLTLPHTLGTFGDDEHRYREGIILAWFLTGDPRFKEAIFDEAEVLKGVDVWEHERSMYRTLIAMTHVIEFTGDTDLRDNYLIPRLQYFTQAGPVNVCGQATGFGWEGTPLAAGAIGPGDRRYYVWNGDLNAEKEPGEFFQARGFITASFGPTAFWHASRVLDPLVPAQQPMYEAARSRMRDLAWWTREELYSLVPGATNPDDFRLVYSYGVCAQKVKSIDNIDFHPILMGMTGMYEDLESVDLPMATAFLNTGAQQLISAKLHNHLDYLLHRLDCQHFFARWLDANGL